MCDGNGGLESSGNMIYSERNNKKSWCWKITSVYCQTKSGQIQGYHYGNGISHNSTLTF